MINIFFFIIILSIIIFTLIDNNSNNYNKNYLIKNEEKDFELDTVIKKRDKYLNYESYETKTENEFIRPKLPWSNIINTDDDNYPYIFCIKLNIPSLNDYENWKQIIPPLNLNTGTKELEIPCKDEASALAIANLISSNFAGQISIREILDKNLLEISINKAKKHEIVKNKLREQIINKLNINDKKSDNFVKNEVINTQNNDNIIDGYDGSDYSYI